MLIVIQIKSTRERVYSAGEPYASILVIEVKLVARRQGAGEPQMQSVAAYSWAYKRMKIKGMRGVLSSDTIVSDEKMLTYIAEWRSLVISSGS